MGFDNSGKGSAKFAGKDKIQTIKQYQQELLIKAKVMPASKLAETAKRNAKLLLDFEASCIDEDRQLQQQQKISSRACPSPGSDSKINRYVFRYVGIKKAI